MRQIQTVRETMRHNKELDNHTLSVEVKNVATDKRTNHRLFFNKENIKLGYIPVQVGNKLQFGFGIKKSYDQDPTLFATANYTVTR